jgi:hypothetical protein
VTRVKRARLDFVPEYLLFLEAAGGRDGRLAFEFLCELRSVSVARPYGDNPEQLGAGGDDEQSDNTGGPDAL